MIIPTKPCYRLTEWSEEMYNDWESMGGCSCHLGFAPCFHCTHEGNPYSLEETPVGEEDGIWEIDTEEEMSRENIVKENPLWGTGLPTYTGKMSFNNKEEKQTMARKLVTVNLWDDDKGLDVENSLVYSFEKVLAEDDSETIIRQVIADHNIGEIIESHNKIRKEHTNKDILNRTGQSVPLEPVKLKNLRWEVVG